ncbi:peroxin [Terramyces sp. JEL0728]|nr:peroxin [Terramyces sp. JEL0728]
MDFVAGIIENHAGKFKTLGVMVASGYMLQKYAKSQWSNWIQEKELVESANSNIKRRFEQNLQDCYFVIQSLLPSISDNLLQYLNVELLTTQLKQRDESKLKKKEMWQELKVITFSRTLSSVYLLSLLTIFTNIQLSLLGRLVYVDSCHRITKLNDESVDPDEKTTRYISEVTEREYLSTSWYFLKVGWKELVDIITQKVKQETSTLALTQVVSFEDLNGIISKIRESIEQTDFAQFMMPKEGLENVILEQSGITSVSDPKKLQGLLDETRDFVQGSDFRLVLGYVLDDCFKLLLDTMKPFFIESVGNQKIGSGVSFISGAEEDLDQSQESLEANYKVFPVAGILPMVSKSVHQVLDGMPNLFLNVLSTHAKLKTFSVIVYSGWE